MDLEKALLKEHSRAQCLRIVDFVGNNAIRFEKLVTLYLRGPYRITQRSAWPLSVCIEHHPSLAQPHLAKLIKFASKPDTHDAVRRNTMRILQLTEIPKRLEGIVIDLAFRFLRDREEPIAVRVFSITVLEKLLDEQPELQQELQIILEDEMPYASAAFRSRGSKVLRKLQRSSQRLKAD